MFVKTFPLGPIGTNCYILHKGEQCLIIDPGAEPEVIMHYLKEEKLIPQAILLTHAHFDHIGAVDVLRNKYAVDVYLHAAEAEWLEKPELNRSLLFFGDAGAVQTAKPERILTVGNLEIGAFTFEVLHTPGHSPGSVTFVFHDEQCIVSGDILFQQSIGRTDLPEGDFEQLMKSIISQLYPLPNHFTVYPGHGPSTKIGIEKKSNPFTTQYYQGS